MRRKLLAGDLSPEEEAAIRQRLEEIEDERNELRQKQIDLYRDEEYAARQLMESGVLSEHELKRVNNRLHALLVIQQGDELSTEEQARLTSG